MKIYEEIFEHYKFDGLSYRELSEKYNIQEEDIILICENYGNLAPKLGLQIKN